MSMVLQATVEGKGHELQSQIKALQGFISIPYASRLTTPNGHSPWQPVILTRTTGYARTEPTWIPQLLAASRQFLAQS